MSAMLRRQFPIRKSFQFRTPPYQNSGEIPDTAPCREAKIPFHLQRFLSASEQKQNPSGFRYLRKNIWMSFNGSESGAGKFAAVTGKAEVPA
ncbi:hypothetical protein [uncultured Akkermansia sp.]|uniref:hypothetical protein n=1 Tax=uncultured Akkermansia sp. TaxID=512294 RepID=UPI0025D7AA31|nr:hypothetical protein [uncultured Akkermansia sp.]